MLKERTFERAPADRAATFDALVERHLDASYRLAGLILRDADDAEDECSWVGIKKRRANRLAVRWSGFDQWWQAPGLPADSEVRKLLPQPQADTAFGLLTVKPAPISVSR
jgi:hypothetical protein